MNADPQERFAFEETKERGIPPAANGAAPMVAHAIDERLGGELFARSQIAHRAQTSRVFQIGITRSPLRISLGGGGTDTFVFSGATFGKDVVTDFEAIGSGSKHDTLQFDHSAFASVAYILAHASAVGKDVVITHDATDTVTLVGVHLNQLTVHDFLIV